MHLNHRKNAWYTDTLSKSESVVLKVCSTDSWGPQDALGGGSYDQNYFHNTSQFHNNIISFFILFTFSHFDGTKLVVVDLLTPLHKSRLQMTLLGTHIVCLATRHRKHSVSHKILRMSSIWWRSKLTFLNLNSRVCIFLIISTPK